MAITCHRKRYPVRPAVHYPFTAVKEISMSLLDDYLSDTLKQFAECRSFRRLAITAFVRIENLKVIEFAFTRTSRDPEKLREILEDLNPLYDVLIGFLSFSYARDVPTKSLELLKDLIQVLCGYEMLYTMQGLGGFAKCYNAIWKNDDFSGSRAGVINFTCRKCGVSFFGPIWCVISGRHDPDLKASAADGTLNTETCPQCKGRATRTPQAIAAPPPPFDTLFLKEVLLYEDDLPGDFSLTLLSPDETPNYNFYANITAHFMGLYEADLPPDQKKAEPGRIHIFDNLDQFGEYLIREEGKTAERDEETFLAGITNSVSDGALSLSAARETVRQSIANRPDRFVKNLLLLSPKEYHPQKRYIHSALMHEAAMALCDEPRQLVATIEFYDDALLVGEIEEAVQVLLNALPAALKYRKDPTFRLLAPEIATRLALVNSDLGDLPQALKFIKLALDQSGNGILEPRVEGESQQEMLAELGRWNILGCILKDIGEMPTAVKVLSGIRSELLKARENIVDPSLHQEAVALSSGVLNNLALAHAKAATFLESTELLGPAQVAHLRKLVPEEEDLDLARRKLADFMRDLEISSLKEAFDLAQESGNVLYQCRQLRNLARYWRARGKPEEALVLNEQSLELARKEGLRSDLADCLTDLGITFDELGRLDEALAVLRTSATEFESQYYLQTGVGYRRRLSEGSSDTFDWLVQVCAESGLIGEVFSSIGRAKARTLAERIDLQVVRPTDPVVMERYDLYLSELRSLEATLWRDQPDLLAHEDSMRPVAHRSGEVSLERFSRMRDLQRELVSFRNRLAKTDSRFGLLSQDIGPDLLGKVTEIIGERGMFLDIYITQKTTYILVLRKAQLSICEIPVKRSEWYRRTKQHWLDPYLLHRQMRSEWVQCVDDIGSYLGEWLWKHLSEATDWSTVDHVVISPHLIFHLLPIHLMKTDSDQYLCDRLRISFVPSARTLVRLAELPSLVASDITTVSSQHEDIPFSRTEVEAIGFLPGLNVHHLGGGRVRKQLLDAKQEADVIHFSCHGIFSTTSSLETGLALSAREFLSFDQIAGKLRVKPGAMAVLSACETGKIFIDNAEEYLGLPYAFLCAGCSTVISSLWHIPDISTALLMTRFYHNLAARCTRLESLGEAQKWIRNSTGRSIAEFLESEGLADIFGKAAEGLRAAKNEKLFSKPVWWGAFCNVGAWS
jgi:CHAT domain-containing protein/tetratricopeptide (TPR) repeat protein